MFQNARNDKTGETGFLTSDVSNSVQLKVSDVFLYELYYILAFSFTNHSITNLIYSLITLHSTNDRHL